MVTTVYRMTLTIEVEASDIRNAERAVADLFDAQDDMAALALTVDEVRQEHCQDSE